MNAIGKPVSTPKTATNSDTSPRTGFDIVYARLNAMLCLNVHNALSSSATP